MTSIPHNLSLVTKVHKRLLPYLQPAPILASDYLSELIGAKVSLKVESLQRSGSFKIRGVLSVLLALKEEGYGKEVVTASEGNHARALALAAKLVGLPCRIFVSSSCSLFSKNHDGAQVTFGHLHRPIQSFSNLSHTVC